MNRKENNQTYYQSTYDIYVGNVPKNINEADVKQLFLKYGEVKQVLCRWKEDYFGYAIVKFTLKNDAERVLGEIDEVTLNGHTMPVKAARRSDHSHHNGYINIENKVNSYTEINKNHIYSGLHFSNTDFGYFHQPKYAEEPPVQSYPMMLEVLCTSVEDAVTFYGCPVNRYEDLLLLSNALNSLNLNHSRHERRPLHNKVYAALFSEDNSWYRCTITRGTLPNNPGKCAVRYIDYGNEEEVNCNSIVMLPESLQKIPAFAKKFVFTNLVCETKSSHKKTYLHQLVNKRMSLSAYISTVSADYQVVKCSCNGKDVISETINKGFAKLQRSVRVKNEVQHSELKPKAYACGSEIRLFNPESVVSPTSIPKAHENQAVNDTTYSIKSRKQPCKNKDISLNTEVYCNGVTEEIKKETDFHPKMIIKRGSELSEIIGNVDSSIQVKEQTFLKAPQLQKPFVILVDTVLSNLKLINDVRSLVSKSSDDSVINSAVSLLKEEFSTIEGTENATKCIKDVLDEYNACIEKIKTCTDQTSLVSLKSGRDVCRNNLCAKLKEYLGSCDNTIFERKEKIQKTIMDLESNSNAWMNVQLKKRPETIDELIVEYNKVKDQRWNLVSKTRENTNKKHKDFLEVFSALQKEFYLLVLEEDDVTDDKTDVPCMRKNTSYGDEMNESLKDLGKALEEEIHMLTLNKVPNHISVIQCLLDILDIHKEKVDSVCELYENHFAMYSELIKVPDIQNITSELLEIQEDIDRKFRDIEQLRLSSIENLERTTISSSVTKQLHQLVAREDCLMEVLAKASESYFPELNLEHPELKLSDYSKNKFLLKNWKKEYFVYFGRGSRGKSSFSSEFLNDPIDIKEYVFENAEELNTFIQKAVTWNSIRSDSFVKIKALFLKDERTVSIVLPPISRTLLDEKHNLSPSEGEMACRILKQVLVSLRDLHSQDLIHRSVHPMTILIENENALLDFCFDLEYLVGNTNLKGINFQPPETKAMHESTDMYGFGCLLLWVLFPNLSFTSTKAGVPNLGAFRSIVEEFIFPKDYALLSALVDAKPERRPSAAMLLNKGFLTKYETYCRTRYDQKKILS